MIAGHYEGIDERVREHLVTDEISIGDYVLTGGELPALVLIDVLTRLIPGVLGDPRGRERFPCKRIAGIPPLHTPGRIPGVDCSRRYCAQATMPR